MKKRLTIIQMDVHVNDVEYNYTRVQELLSQSLSECPDIIVLPETWNTGFYPSKELINIADRNGERTKSLLSTFAKEHNVNIVGGSVAVAKMMLCSIPPMPITEKARSLESTLKCMDLVQRKKINTSQAVRTPHILS